MKHILKAVGIALIALLGAGMIDLFREADENPRFVHDLQSMKNSR